MDPQKSSEISALAGVVRESLELSVPVDVVKAVDRLGGTVKEVEVAPGLPEAAVRRTGERFEITIRKDHVEVRKRFSVAHEIGHLILHMGYLISPERWGHSSEYCDSVYHRFGYGIEEAEANLFAAAFLMPEEEFRGAVMELGRRKDLPSKDLVKELALQFRTSFRAALWRGEELGIFRVGVNGL